MNKNKKELLVKGDGRLERISLAEARNMVYEKFRINIRLLRAQKGLSGCECSDQIGLKNGKRMIDLEYGRANPDIEELMMIANFFKVNIDSLLHKETTVCFNDCTNKNIE